MICAHDIDPSSSPSGVPGGEVCAVLNALVCGVPPLKNLQTADPADRPFVTTGAGS